MSDLPNGWTWATLDEISQLSRKTVDPNVLPHDTPYVGLEHIEAGGRLLGHDTVGNADLKSTKVHFTPRHILVGKLRPYLGKITDVSFSGVGSTDILPLQPGGHLDRQYLLHYLRQPRIVEHLNSMSTGANLPRLSPKSLLGLRIPLPPPEEQRRIATILDRAAALDTAAVRGLELLETLADGTFERSYQALPAKSSTTLEHIADIGSGITKGRKTPNGPLSEVPYLTVANVQDGKLALDTVKTIAVSEAERAKYALQHDDIVLTEGGDPDKLGRGTVWRSEIPGAIHQNHVFRVTPDPSAVISLYLSLAIRSFTSKQYFLRSAKQTTGIATINKTQLRRTPLRVPPLNVQQGILDRMERIYSLRSAWENRRNSIAPLTQSLQSRAFRGEL